MSNTVYALLAVLVCAIVTFLLRFAPFALFSGKRGMPEPVRRLAAKMPAAIIAVLVIYCLKAVPTSDMNAVIVNLASVAFVVVLHLWKKNTLLSIAGGTALYMALLRII